MRQPRYRWLVRRTLDGPGVFCYATSRPQAGLATGMYARRLVARITCDGYTVVVTTVTLSW